MSDWTPHPGWVERDHPATPGGRSFDLRFPSIGVFLHTPSNQFGRGDVGFIGNPHDTLEEGMEAAEGHIATVLLNRIEHAQREIRQSSESLSALLGHEVTPDEIPGAERPLKEASRASLDRSGE